MVPRFEVVLILVISVQGLKFQTENDADYGKKWMYLLDENNIFQKVYLEMPYSRLTPFALEDDEVAQLINFTLYTRKSIEGNPVTFNHVNLTKSGFHPFRKTKSITHGWMSSGTADTCITIKDEYLKKADLNIIIMDWSAISKNVMYPIPMANTLGVGKRYAKFLDFLMISGGKGSDIHLIGHSLGAHISGYAAKYVTKESIGRVTALDPAGVGFKESEYKEGLPGTFVDVIHTSSGILGLKEKVGDIDFYPNGGVSPQPGCNVLDQFGVGCSHGRSWKLFAESINGAISMATKCQSWGDYQNRRCGGMRAPMGDPVSINAEFGSYFLDTNGEVPYMRSNNE